jgi:hypothetical protein
MSSTASFPQPGGDSQIGLTVGSYFGNLGRSVDLEENVLDPSEVNARDEDIDVAFWNIEWFNKNVDKKVRPVARFIADMNLDVWALEETSPQATERLVKLLEDAYGLDFDFNSSEPNAPNAKQSTTVMWNRNTVIGEKKSWPEEIEEVLRLSSQDNLEPLEQLEEAIHGKIFDRYPGLFHLRARNSTTLNFYLVPLHLKAMAEGSLRRQLASRVLAAAVNRMIRDGKGGDWVLGGDINAPLSSGDFEQLDSAGLTAVSAQDAEAGAISYIKGPKSLIDHIYLSPNMAARFGAENFTIISAEKEIPKYTQEMSDHRPVMIRLNAGGGGEEEGIEEGVAADSDAKTFSLPTPDWLKNVVPLKK